VQREGRHRGPQRGHSRPPWLGDETDRGGAGQAVALEQLLDERDGGQRRVDRPTLRRTGRDGGRPDGTQRPHPRRHELVEPPAQR
jgi:hypothetical protein